MTVVGDASTAMELQICIEYRMLAGSDGAMRFWSGGGCAMYIRQLVSLRSLLCAWLMPFALYLKSI